MSSTTLRMEKSRLKPCSGLSLLNFGFRDSPVTSSLVWAKVAVMASSAVASRKGPATMQKVRIHLMRTFGRMPESDTASGLAI